MTGIYKIESRIKPDRIYIGSAVNLKHRRETHISSLRLNKHQNNKLQHHFNKYGESDLLFTVICNCVKDELINQEQHYINLYNPYFNICRIAGSLLGTKRDLIAKKKMSDAWKNRKPMSLTTKIKISLGNKGRIKSEKEINKISKALKGKKLSDATKGKIRNAHLGRKLSIEHRSKIIKSLLGNKRTFGIKQSEETQNKKRMNSPDRHGSNNPRFNVTVTQKTKDKMKEAQIKRWMKIKEMRRLESSFSTK